VRNRGDERQQLEGPGLQANPNWSRLGGALLLISWAALIIAAYYVPHKPWTGLRWTAPWIAMADLGLAVGLWLIAGGLGRALLGPLSGLHPWERAALNLAIGLGLGALGLLALGWMGGFQRVALWTLLALGLAFLRKGWWAFLAQCWEGMRATWPAGSFAWASAIFSSVGALSALAFALAPPFRWDGLVYHLELPRQYLAAGKLVAPAGNLFFGFPQTAEMWFTWAMGLRSGSTAATLGWMVGMTALCGLVGLIGRRLGGQLGWLASAFLISGWSFISGLGSAYVDWWVLLFGLAMLIALLEWGGRGGAFWPLLAGLAAGFGLATKYTAAMLPLLGAGWVWFFPAQQDRVQAARLRVRWRAIGVFAAAAAIPVLPWLMKNLALAGNPLHPYGLSGIAGLHSAFFRRGGIEGGVVTVLTLPWLVTVLGVEGAAGPNASIGPLLLAFLPGLLLGSGALRESLGKSSRALGFYALGGVLLWAAGALASGMLIQSRFYFGLFPAFAMLAVAGFDELSRMRAGAVRFGRLAQGLVLLAYAFSLAETATFLLQRSPQRAVMGAMDETAYLQANLGAYPLAMEAMNALPEEAKILMLWEPRAYYCPRHCVPDVFLDRWWIDRQLHGDPRSIFASLRGQGITHLLIYQAGMEFELQSRAIYTPQDWADLAAFRSQFLQPVDRIGHIYVLYRLHSSGE